MVIGASVAVVATPAFLQVAEELAALLTGRWGLSAERLANPGESAPASLYVLGSDSNRWRRVEPADVAQTLRARDAGARRPVLLVHGLDEPGSIWFELAPALRSAGKTPIRIVYANDAGIHAAAQAVHTALASLAAHGVVEVDIVAHSMGGLAAWDALAPAAPLEHADGDAPQPAIAPLPAVRRLILIASPVHGAPLAHLRSFAEAREQLVRLFSPSLSFDLSAFLRDGAGQASVDLAPESAYLRQLRSRGAPQAQRVGVIAASLAPLGATPQPDSLAAMLGDGAVPTYACVPPWADEVQLIRGAHRFILKSLASRERTPPASLPPAAILSLEMLAAP